MRTTLRTLQALALLLGFYLLTLALLTGIVAVTVGITAAAVRAGQFGMGLYAVWGVGLVLAYPLVRGLFAGHVGSRAPRGAVRVTPEQQPQLWARVRRVAELMRVAPPAELWLDDEVNASVRQGSWLLGLVPGRRRMRIGLPLLGGLTVAELDAVIGHELGHFGHGDAFLGGLTHRNREGLRQILARYSGQEGGHGAWFGQLFARYARFCLRVSRTTAREQELAADAAAARVAGPEAMAGALRGLVLLARAQERYRAGYVDIGRKLELAPPAEELLPGFLAFLDTESWATEAAQLEADPPRRRASPYDSHPPTEERLARLRELPPVGPGSVGGTGEPDRRPAHELLERPAETGALVAARQPGAERLRRLDRTELAAACGRAELEAESAALVAAARAVLRRSSGLPEILDMIDAGRWTELADWMPREGMSRTVTSAAGRSMNAAAASDCLYSMTLATLVAQGRGRWTLGPGSGLRLDLDPGLDAALGPALDAAVEAVPADTAPLRALVGPAGPVCLSPPSAAASARWS